MCQGYIEKYTMSFFFFSRAAFFLHYQILKTPQNSNTFHL